MGCLPTHAGPAQQDVVVSCFARVVSGVLDLPPPPRTVSSHPRVNTHIRKSLPETAVCTVFVIDRNLTI